MAQRPILERKNVFGARLIERRAAQLLFMQLTIARDAWATIQRGQAFAFLWPQTY